MTPDRRAVLFLRMGELLHGHAVFLSDPSERIALADGWLEIAPEVKHEMDALRLEQHDTLTEYAAEAGE